VISVRLPSALAKGATNDHVECNNVMALAQRQPTGISASAKSTALCDFQVCGQRWFTESFDTSDLQNTKALLAELSA
jgi:hypothetical protein